MHGWVYQHRDRGDPDYRLDAVLTLPAFINLIIELILHNNMFRKVNQVPVGFHRTLDYHPRPLELWEWGIASKIGAGRVLSRRSEEHTSELQSLSRLSYRLFCLTKKNNTN